MKKILLSATCMLSVCSLLAQAPPFVNEDTIQLNNIWDYPGFLPVNINAHSHGDLNINGLNSDLYVSTWDYGNPFGSAVNQGFVVRQYIAGTQVKNGTSALYQAIRDPSNNHLPYNSNSLEAGILTHNDSVFIALTYSGDVPSPDGYIRTFFLRMYLWNPALPGGPLIELNTYTLGQTGDPTYFWIHQDVNNLNKIAITWELDGGQMLTCAGEITSSGFHLSGVKTLGITGGISKPDVAMMTKSNGTTDLYYVLISSSNTKLTVYRGDFNTLYNNPSSFSISPIFNKLASGTFGLPRIDAPDNAQYTGQENVWSCVVADHTATNDYIFAATSSNQTGISTRILNNGSGLGSLPDISATSNPANIYNRRPVVAFSNENLEVFYAWVFRNSNWYNSFYTPPFSLPVNPVVSYLSVKTTLPLSLINNPNYQYFVIPYHNYNDNMDPSVGLSTQNDASPQLFTAFSMGGDQPYIPYLGLKSVDWSTTTGYKPSGSTGITSVLKQNNFSISPNPFHSGFQIQVDNLSHQSYSLSLYNILGQKVYESKGSVAELNRDIRDVGNKLNSGTYFMQLNGENGSTFRKEMVKW